MAKVTKETPLMKQYNQIKAKYPDALLLFRVGDFYETFGEDAIKTANVLNIVLTKRNNGTENNELAGFPYHSLKTYLPRLVKAGYRVAICDQLEDPKQTKTIVKRGVTELVTPGVALDDEILQAKTNNFLASIVIGKHKNGISFLDISTGEFLTAEGDIQYLDKLLQNFNPSEILVSRTQKKDFLLHFGDNFQISTLEDWIYTQDYAFETLTKHFQTNSLKGFGIDDFNEAIISAGAILFYLSETEHNQLKHLSSIQRIPQDEYVWLDRFTIRNLELYNGQSPQSVTLLDIIDKTISPMGSRTLKRWIALPLKNLQKIQQRHEIVNSLLQKKDIYEKIREKLNEISDIERLISKVATQKITPRELIQLKNSLLAIEPIKKYIYNLENPYINSFFGEKLDNCTELISSCKYPKR